MQHVIHYAILTNGGGRRIVTLVELAWATAPGDPNGDDLPAEPVPSAASA